MTQQASSLVLRPSEPALYKGRAVEIEGVLGMNTVQIKDLVDGKSLEVPIAEIAPRPKENDDDPRSNKLSTEEASEQAELRFDVIKPLLAKPDRTRGDVKQRAAEYGYGTSTLYRWIGAYDYDEHESLNRKQRSDKGRKLLAAEVETIITNTLANLKPECRGATQIHSAIKEKIEARNAPTPAAGQEGALTASDNISAPTPLDIPSISTIRNRILEIPAKVRHAHLHGKQAAEQEYDPILGSFPGADWPLSIVQIDHVLLDIILVDDIHREPIGRPWLTASFDVFSRMVSGIEDSLDPPGAMSTGLCIVHSILPKYDWLKGLGSQAEWPVWGKPGCFHADNAFRMNMLKAACKEHGTDLMWRPVRKPRFGGHIERWAGTLGRSIHYLPGTTFSDPKARGTYDSEAKAKFTQKEFRSWLAEQIGAYHATEHSQLGMPPLERYRIGIFKGTDKHPATGLQPQIRDPEAQNRLRLDLMPFVERTVQRYGIEIDKIFYYSDVLRRWINANDPEHPKLKRLFRCRRFYRDISSIWFYDPDMDKYFEIPTRDPTLPSMSIWELHKIRRLAKAEGVPDEQVDEEYIKHRYNRMREIEDQAEKNTKAARKEAARRNTWNTAPRPTVERGSQERHEEVMENEAYERVRGFTEDD